MKPTKRIRIAQISINGLKDELHKNEESNMNIRRALSILWDDKDKQKEVRSLLKKLVKGRAITKALQENLHANKTIIKVANRQLDNMSKNK